MSEITHGRGSQAGAASRCGSTCSDCSARLGLYSMCGRQGTTNRQGPVWPTASRRSRVRSIKACAGPKAHLTKDLQAGMRHDQHLGHFLNLPLCRLGARGRRGQLGNRAVRALGHHHANATTTTTTTTTSNGGLTHPWRGHRQGYSVHTRHSFVRATAGWHHPCAHPRPWLHTPPSQVQAAWPGVVRNNSIGGIVHVACAHWVYGTRACRCTAGVSACANTQAWYMRRGCRARASGVWPPASSGRLWPSTGGVTCARARVPRGAHCQRGPKHAASQCHVTRHPPRACTWHPHLPRLNKFFA